MSDARRGVCFVTGGSRGIGAATARLAAARGYDVAMTYLSRADDARPSCRRRRGAGPPRARGVGRRRGRSGDVGAFRAADALGPLTLLVNNAGIVGDVGRARGRPGAMLERLVRINVVGAFIAAREAVRRMSTQHGGRGGSIVNVSSGASQLGSPNVWVHYAATKGALDTMTIGLAKEVAGEGIRVNAVRPGIIDTEIHAASTARPGGRRSGRRCRWQRIGTVDEVARAILWLASDEASYVTGAMLDARGGI